MSEPHLIYSSPAGYAAMQAWYAALLAKNQIPYESHTVPTRFGDTHLLAAGPVDAPPVILLHGMEGTALSWRYQLDALSSGLRLYALDIIGSAGKSAPIRLPDTGNEHAEWLIDVLAGLKLDNASFVGISNGSWLIIKLAELAPDRITRAALLSANGIVPVRFPFNLARLLEVSPVREMRSVVSRHVIARPLVRATVTLTSPSGITLDPDEIEWFYLLAKHYHFRFPPGPVTDEQLRSLVAPTLVLMGEHDTFFVPHVAVARARELLPQVHAAEVLAGVGHNMISEMPDLINTRLDTFLRAA
ncbi:MAG: alpha/beta fold hydrolase [Ktedonobacterales bacterium]